MINEIVYAAATAASPTGTAAIQIPATFADKVIISVGTNLLVAAETVTIWYFSQSGILVPVPKPDLSAQISLTATVQSIMLEGGFLYAFQKSLTASAVSIEYAIKPRIA